MKKFVLKIPEKATLNYDDLRAFENRCSYDLYFAFPYLKSQISDEQRRAIIHYFNLSILYEILDLLFIASNTNLVSEPEINHWSSVKNFC